MFIGDVLFIAGHLAARVTAVAVALSVTVSAPASRWLVPAWLVVEYIALNLARWLEADSWRYWLRGGDGYVWGAVCNIGYYASVSAVPLLWMRIPLWVCPHIWACGIVAAVLSNFALLATAFHLTNVSGDGGGAASAAAAFPAFEVLAACTGVEVLGFLLVLAYMVPRFRPTLWRRRTTQEHVELSLWVLCAPSSKYGPTPNDSRARTLATFSTKYWPRKEIVTAWLRENWGTWQTKATRPHWFTAKPVGFLQILCSD